MFLHVLVLSAFLSVVHSQQSATQGISPTESISISSSKSAAANVDPEKINPSTSVTQNNATTTESARNGTKVITSSSSIIKPATPTPIHNVSTPKQSSTSTPTVSSSSTSVVVTSIKPAPATSTKAIISSSTVVTPTHTPASTVVVYKCGEQCVILQKRLYTSAAFAILFFLVSIVLGVLLYRQHQISLDYQNDPTLSRLI